MAATGVLTLERAGRTITEAGQPAWHAAGGGAPPSGNHSGFYCDVDGWSFPLIGTNPPLVTASGWVATAANTSLHHAALSSHGVDTSNHDFQIQFVADTAATGGGHVAVWLYDASSNGYQVRVGADHVLYTIDAGVRSAALVTFAKVSGDYVPCYVEWTYESATGTWRCYEDGTELGSWVNSTHAAADKAQMLVTATTEAAPANQTRYRTLFVQDFIAVRGNKVSRPYPLGD